MSQARVQALARRTPPSYAPRVTSAAPRRATREDLANLPENVTGELIRGSLVVLPRPRPHHARSATRLAGRVQGAYDFGDDGGPGGWWILVEPGVRLPALDVEEIVPDVAGWRREHLEALPSSGPIERAPDWVCEVLSPTTRRHDLVVKRPLYVEAGVRWMWIVDLDARTLTASRAHEGRWLEIGVWSDDDLVRAEPFGEVTLRGSELWGAT